MKSIYLKIPYSADQSIYTEHHRSDLEYIANPLHFHTEVELLLVLKGEGTRIIGNNVDYFSPGNISMICSKVPHVWHFDEKLSQGKQLSPEYIFILFHPEKISEAFRQWPEAKIIIELIQNSQRGIRLYGKTLQEITKLMKSICNASGFKQITLLLSILEIISSCQEYQFLSGPNIPKTIKETDTERLNLVYNYILNNYQNNITLDQAASLASLCNSAFCRYFKKRTNKTFYNFLIEIRLAYACKLLTEEDHSVANICYYCGFANVSHFIHQFRKYTGYTPLNYRKKYEETLNL